MKILRGTLWATLRVLAVLVGFAVMALAIPSFLIPPFGAAVLLAGFGLTYRGVVGRPWRHA